MAFTLESIVPWGRSLEEYARMFALSDSDLSRRILGCGDGPASFNAEWTQRGGHVISFDPIYQYSAAQIEARFEMVYPQMLAELEKNVDDFAWDFIRSPQDLGQRRRKAKELFIEDYQTGAAEGRYIAASLPQLPFADNTFDLALSSHFLFLYSQHLTLDFHRQSIPEMLRVAREARIFPLLQLGGAPSPYIETITRELRNIQYSVDRCKVDYEFQKGGNEMLRIWRDAT